MLALLESMITAKFQPDSWHQDAPCGMVFLENYFSTKTLLEKPLLMAPGGKVKDTRRVVVGGFMCLLLLLLGGAGVELCFCCYFFACFSLLFDFCWFLFPCFCCFLLCCVCRLAAFVFLLLLLLLLLMMIMMKMTMTKMKEQQVTAPRPLHEVQH